MSSQTVLIAFSDERAARLLADYLTSQQIPAGYHRLDGEHAHAVVVSDAQQLNEARTIADAFVANPRDSKYQQAAWQHGQATKLTEQSTGSWQLSGVAPRQAPFTYLVLAICCVTFVMQMLGMSGAVFSVMQIEGFERLADSGQWWRLFTPAFLHFSLLHIIFNLLWWWSLGGQIERLFGTSTLLLLFVSSALLSNVGQLITSGPNFGGLSGVVYAVVGFVWWAGWLRPQWGLSLPKPVIGFLLIWLVLGYMDVLWVNMANTAHTVGLISGCLFAWLMVQIGNRNGDSRSG